jgi:hypothetical protein
MSSIFSTETKSLRQNFQDDRDMKTVAKQWLIKQKTYCYQKAIEVLAPRQDKCVNAGEVCMGK